MIMIPPSCGQGKTPKLIPEWRAWKKPREGPQSENSLPEIYGCRMGKKTLPYYCMCCVHLRQTQQTQREHPNSTQKTGLEPRTPLAVSLQC